MSEEELETKIEEPEQSSSGSMGKIGKIFLITGIVLVQIAAAYTLVNGFYPEISNFTAGFESSGGVYYEFDNIIINPANSNGERYLIMSITIELNDGSALGTLDARKAEVQDRINTVMSNHSASELNSLAKRDLIKKELGIVINEVIDKKSVRNLFFTKYVLQ